MGRLLLFAVILGAAMLIAFRLVRDRSLATSPSAPLPVVSSAPPTEVLAAPTGLPGDEVDAGLPIAENPLSDVLCPPGMVLVEAAEGGEQTFRFCIDRYEYPNLARVLPAAMIHFDEARRSCGAEGKRLCSEKEWTFACEGASRLAFSYGSRFRPTVCNVGQEALSLQWQVFANSERTAEEVGRIDARVASGSRPGCVSSTGVYDLLGNVQEWVTSDRSDHGAVLKGGDFHRKYVNCRQPSDVEHRLSRAPNNGFRCCAAPFVEAPQRNGQGPK